jgi:transposase
VEQASGRKRRKYSSKFKQAAVDRLVGGESATAIAKRLKIRRKLLYAWRNEGFGSNPPETASRRASDSDLDPQQQQIAQHQEKIAELERLIGRQAAELDFFASALRAVNEARPKRSGGSGSGSTQRSRV